MSLSIKQLNAFQKVARLQSFSDAVAITGLSQPTLSRLIKQLEQELDVELIDRYHRPLQLTNAGKFFYDKIDFILKELESTVVLTRKIAHPPNVLNIGFVPSVLHGLLPVIISTLKRRLPSLDVHLKDISSFKQLDALKSGTIDVGFGRFSHEDSGVKQLLLRHERYVAALPKSHPLAYTQNIQLNQLKNDKVILYHQTHLPITLSNSKKAISEPLLHLFAKQTALPHQTVPVTDIQIALGLVAAGEGVTLVPESLRTVRTEQINYSTLIHEDATSPIYICTLEQPQHPVFEILLDVIYGIYEKRGITYRRKS